MCLVEMDQVSTKFLSNLLGDGSSKMVLLKLISSTVVDAQLDDLGMGFVQNSINAIEKRGMFLLD